MERAGGLTPAFHSHVDCLLDVSVHGLTCSRCSGGQTVIIFRVHVKNCIECAFCEVVDRTFFFQPSAFAIPSFV